ncbi:MAG: integrase core domain-containing protein [Acidimicrobiales bacterium]
MSGPIPARVDEAAKTKLLSIIEAAVAQGWSLARACGVLELDRRRAWRWQARAAVGALSDRPPGGNPIHGLLDWEEAAIVELFDTWGPVDLSHRKLAHRGSYLDKVWVSPSTVDRVLARHGLRLKGGPRPGRSQKKPWPDWTEWRPNQLWCWDASQFERCTAAKYAYGIVDLVSRKWIATILVPEATGTQVRVLFLKALQAEGLLTDSLAERLADLDDAGPDDDLPEVPLLVAISDNGTEMRCRDTRRFLAACSIAQHFGRPSTPTDQAWIETLWGHVKYEHPHLMAITDPAVLAAELERVRVEYNSVRLHEAIGYVTPNDEHEGRGDAIRKARQEGLERADQKRRLWHRKNRGQK